MADDIEFNLTAKGESFLSTMSSALDVLGQVARAAQQLGSAFVDVAREADRQGAIMTSFRGNLSQAREATQGLVSDIRMMQAANELNARGIQASGNDLRNIFVAAVERADATGADLNETIDQLTNAIGTGAPRALRQFGIEGDNANEILDSLDENFGDVEVSADSAADAIDQFVTALENGETAFFDGISNTENLETAFSDLMETVGVGATDFEDAMDAIARAGFQVGVTIVEHFATAIENLQVFLRVLHQVREGNFQAALALSVETALSTPLRTNDRIDAQMAEFDARRAGSDSRDERVIGQPDRTRRRDAANDNGDPFSPEAMEEGNRSDIEFERELRQATTDEEVAALEERRDAELEIEREIQTELRAMKDEEAERLQEDHEAKLDMLEEERRKSMEAAQEVQDTAFNVLQPVVSGLTDALASVIAGTKSADEAFQGMLASFLEMISQEAALQAAKEFAMAIASFASQDYGGGALHIAAGVGFTAVAVAAGAASIAVAPSAAQPASPEQNAGSSSGGGGNVYNISYNGPYVSAGGRADAGRELDELIGEGRRMYGAAA